MGFLKGAGWLLVALACAFLGWALFHYLGMEAFIVMLALGVVQLAVKPGARRLERRREERRDGHL